GQARPRARSWMAGSGAGNEEYGLQLARILLAAGDAEQGTNTMGLDTIEGVRLRALLEELGYEPDFRWAWDHYAPVVKALSQRLGLGRLCEIGGGRNPLLTLSEGSEIGARYKVNDISAGGLSLVPDGCETACFDGAGDPAALPAALSFDLVFSRMVFEHLRDVAGAWANLHRLLKPGGVALAFIPTLYALPFMTNRLVPEWLSGAIVDRLYPHRDRDGS